MTLTPRSTLAAATPRFRFVRAERTTSLLPSCCSRAHPTPQQPSVDHNCNGVYGKAPNGSLWEDLLCGGTQSFGTIILGDSAAAHFHVPPEFITAKELSKTTYTVCRAYLRAHEVLLIGC